MRQRLLDLVHKVRERILICPVCFPVPLCRITSRVDIDGSGEVSGAEFAEWLSHETESLSR